MTPIQMYRNKSQMKLRDKTFTRNEKGCELSSPRPDSRHINNDLFASDWEVFVIRHDKASGKHNWFTLCCERASLLSRPPLRCV